MKFTTPEDALGILITNKFRNIRGVLIPPKKDHVLSNEEYDALNYLCHEYDYDFALE